MTAITLEESLGGLALGITNSWASEIPTVGPIVPRLCPQTDDSSALGAGKGHGVPPVIAALELTPGV